MNRSKKTLSPAPINASHDRYRVMRAVFMFPRVTMWCLNFGDQRKTYSGFPLAIWPRRAHTVTGPPTCFQLRERSGRRRAETGASARGRDGGGGQTSFSGRVQRRESGWQMACKSLCASEGVSWFFTEDPPPPTHHTPPALSRREWMNSQTRVWRVRS